MTCSSLHQRDRQNLIKDITREILIILIYFLSDLHFISDPYNIPKLFFNLLHYVVWGHNVGDVFTFDDISEWFLNPNPKFNWTTLFTSSIIRGDVVNNRKKGPKQNYKSMLRNSFFDSLFKTVVIIIFSSESIIIIFDIYYQ